MRNKRIADLSVVILIILIIIITLTKMNFGNNEWLEVLSFIIEAALVGSIADWFAITALFEEPFLVRKIPIIASHTAIISKNRESIVNAVAYVVQNELLSEKVLRGKIEEINIIDALIDFIDLNINTRSELYEVLIDYFIERIESVDTLKFAEFLETKLKQKIELIDISVYINKGISYGIQSEEFKRTFNIIIKSIIEYVNRDSTKKILEKFVDDIIKKEANSLVMEKIISILKSVNAINTSDITISLLEQINKLLLSLKNENDLLRCKIIENITQLFEKVHTDNEVRSDIENWKIKILKEISIQDDLNVIIKDFIKIITEKEVFLCNTTLEECNKVERKTLSKEDIISVVTLIKIQLKKYWNEFKTNNVNKKNIDQFIKRSVFKIIESKYDHLGHIVKQVLNNMDDKSLNNFIKQKAGNDLHGIRINGCIVGALFGGTVFAVTHLIYNLILPNIFNLKF
ncbi:MAG TPA: DUF445 domain-containing protein [Clostridium sp.]|uniref:DUF445 domain-containing protein n=1 Tax=Clostridium sp. TaxID=1506 RepID=UPI002F95D1D9